MKSFLRTFVFFIYFLSFSVNSQSILPAKKSSDSLISLNSNSDFFLGFDLALTNNSAHLNLFNIGYKFNDTFGVNYSLGMLVENFDADQEYTYQDILIRGYNSTNTFITYSTLGPLINTSIGNIYWEFKPQYLYGQIYGNFPVTNSGNLSGTTFAPRLMEKQSGQGFIIGNTFVKNLNKRNRSTGFRFVLNFDYVKAQFFNLQGEINFGDFTPPASTVTGSYEIEKFRAGFGIRYNF